MYPSVRTESSRGTREGNIYNFCLLRFLHRWPSIDPSTEWIGQRKRQQIRISRARVNTVSPTLEENRFDASPFHVSTRLITFSIPLRQVARFNTNLIDVVVHRLRTFDPIEAKTRFGHDSFSSNLYLFYSILLLLLLLSMKDLRFSARLLFQLY